jgi:hypothetical protein
MYVIFRISPPCSSLSSPVSTSSRLEGAGAADWLLRVRPSVRLSTHSSLRAEHGRARAVKRRHDCWCCSSSLYARTGRLAFGVAAHRRHLVVSLRNALKMDSILCPMRNVDGCNSTYPRMPKHLSCASRSAPKQESPMWRVLHSPKGRRERLTAAT